MNSNLGTSRDWLESYAKGVAADNGIPEDYFFRFIDTESSWNPNAVSSKGAQGIAQIMPKYYPDVNTFDPYESLRKAGEILKGYFEDYGDWRLAFAAYNAGPGNVSKYNGVPPFEETQNYVKKIIGNPNLSLVNRPSSAQEFKPAVTFIAFVIAVFLIVLGFGGFKKNA